jgi:3-oxoacyl-[acyl-carrier protein] reductase/meso-butanediol dehydrogenase/(S,S)-butanediol dehydrogenase/diacetyl reductase
MYRSVVVTGGSKGIGWEIVKVFAQNGYKVVSGSRTLRNNIPNDLQDKIQQVIVDVRNRDDHLKLIDEALNFSGALDCYINNAGFSEWRPISLIDHDFLKEIFETNLFGYFWGCQAAAKVLRPGGSILNISSVAGKRGSTNNSAYSSTKFGVTALTQSLCKELGPIGIRVNSVCPVLIETPGLLHALESSEYPATLGVSDFLNNFAINQTALSRLPTIAEVANLCLFLCSEGASGITGQSINVDCGVLPN